MKVGASVHARAFARLSPRSTGEDARAYTGCEQDPPAPGRCFYNLLQLAIHQRALPSKLSFSPNQFRWTFPRKTIQKRRAIPCSSIWRSL
jgi:hypothetical protein